MVQTEMTEERICECEDRTIEATLSKQQAGRKEIKQTQTKNSQVFVGQ